jgi:hypothetical protein
MISAAGSPTNRTTSSPNSGCGRKAKGSPVRVFAFTQPVGCHILRCQDRQNADAGPRGGHVNALDPFMGMCRPQ